ncbi:hypothetical protein [Plasmodium yoelii yoelii]|uniref:Uncharacterized protein n=1 Tax=Plasmodium yoelii yoelii TaxID=73239 RepID=Q7RDI2_PLAYO|nr:hypothetical protein [Plasmodium yoelii yoelii]
MFYIKNYPLPKKFCKTNEKIYKNNYFNIIINATSVIDIVLWLNYLDKKYIKPINLIKTYILPFK